MTAHVQTTGDWLLKKEEQSVYSVVGTCWPVRSHHQQTENAGKPRRQKKATEIYVIQLAESLVMFQTRDIETCSGTITKRIVEGKYTRKESL